MDMQATRHIETILGENIEAARKSEGLTRRELAGRVNDVDPLAIYRWERSGVMPNAANLQALADALGRTVAWFYTDHGQEAA
jgi:transcriptional regulator with XRE-family HTH domain